MRLGENCWDNQTSEKLTQVRVDDFSVKISWLSTKKVENEISKLIEILLGKFFSTNN